MNVNVTPEFIANSLDTSQSLIHHLINVVETLYPNSNHSNEHSKINFQKLIENWFDAQIIFRFLNENGGVHEEITTSQIFFTVVENARRLIEKYGFRSKERILLLCDPGSDFIIAFFSALFAGMIAVPSYPPWDERAFEKLFTISKDCTPTGVIMSDEYYEQIANDLDEVESSLNLGYSLKWIRMSDLFSISTHKKENHTGEVIQRLSESLSESFCQLRPVWKEIDGECDAFLQYTSGSTGTPKGVRVIHKNLCSHSKIILKAWRYEIGDIVASWLPPYHDMQLLGTIICSLSFNMCSVVMSPLTFLHNPFIWLKAISKYRCKGSGGPNFAYELCVAKVSDDRLKELDLSCWELAYCGAEAVKPETLQRFTEKFGLCGFNKKAYYPCYGLAEATLMVTGGNRGESAIFLNVDAKEYLVGRVVLSDSEGPNVLTLVSSGYSNENMQHVEIVDPQTKAILTSPYQIGEIWIRRSSVSPTGYWNQPEKSRETFYARTTSDNFEYIITGDLGFFGENRALFISGRSKDLIIIRGRNIYPPDVEEEVHPISPSFRKGCLACFSIDGTDTEEMIFLAELREVLPEDEMKSLAIQTQQVIFKKTSVIPKEIVFIKTRTMPKTTSGKIRRFECRQWYLENKLTVHYRFSGTLLPSPVIEMKPNPIATSSGYSKNQLQRIVIDNLKLITGSESIDSTTAFSDLGLDSLKSVELISKLSSILGFDISPTIVFKCPTVEKLCHHLSTIESCETRKTLDARSEEKIAIVGMSGRFANADNIEIYWENIRNQVDSIRSSSNILDERANRFLSTTYAGFLNNVYAFDANYFGISGREAQFMDPQQRLALEVAAEALMDACITNPFGLDAGVFVGATNYDFSHLAFAYCEENSHHISTGSSGSIISNRISYIFDFKGPSVTVDTACSSSLTAIHQACQSLKNGECTVALAGGVNTILSEKVSESLKPFLSPNHRCRTFDDSADGYVRGEGVGFVVLKTLSNALKDGDNIYSIIRGSHVAQDGKSNGLSSPNQEAQTSLLRTLYDTCGVSLKDVGYIEAHGTGTKLGDPIEVFALSEALGERESPLLIGSVKSNIGHLEAAAGIAGLIKGALCLKNEEIPPSIHFDTPNSIIPFEKLGISVVKELVPWKRNNLPRYCGVSSFGFGGTLAHILLEEAPQVSEDSKLIVSNIELPVIISAPNKENLEAQAIALKDWLLANRDLHSLQNISYSTIQQLHQKVRVAFNSKSIPELIEKLSFAIENKTFGKLSRRMDNQELCFIFPGQGPEFSTQCAEYLIFDSFKSSIDTSTVIVKEMGVNINFEKAITEGWDLNNTVVNQLVRVTTQIALIQLWKDFGINPTLVCGHSLGEIVAVYTAGWITHKDALNITFIRAKALHKLEGKGLMLIARITAKELKRILQNYEIDVSIASYNSRNSLTLSGSVEAIKKLEEILTEEGISYKDLGLNVPYHSDLVASVEHLMQELTIEGNNAYLNSNIQVISTVTGSIIDRESILSAEHWITNMKNAVLFQDAITTISQKFECHHFLEVAGRQVLSGIIHQELQNGNIAVIPSVASSPQIVYTLADLYCQGFSFNFKKLVGESCICCTVPLPKYVWNHSLDYIPDFIRNISKPISLSDIVASLHTSGDAYQIENTDAVLTHQESIENVCEVAVLRAFNAVGWNTLEHDTYAIRDVQRILKISSMHDKLFKHLLVSVLAKYEIAKIEGDTIDILCSLPSSLHGVAITSTNDDLIAHFSHLNKESPEIALLLRALNSLQDAIRGKTSALHVLFPEASVESVEYLYEESITSLAYNSIFSDFVFQLLTKSEVPLNILEIGAGTAGLTSHIINKTKSLNKIAEYMFTDISRLFINHGQNKFKDHKFMKFAQFNVEKSPNTQGFERKYDIVIAANVLHATKNLHETLSNVKELLKSKGILIFLEVTRPSLFLDLTFGLTEGWWRFEDVHLRKSYPLLSHQKWIDTLASQGFSSNVNITEGFALPFQSVIAGQIRSATPSTSTSSISSDLVYTNQAPSLQQILEANPPDIKSENDLVEYIKTVISQILMIDPESIHPEDKLADLGVDSLTALELKNAFQKSFQISLNLSNFDEKASISSLVSLISTGQPIASPSKSEGDVENHISLLLEEFESDIPTCPPTILAMGIGEAPYIYQQAELLQLSETFYKDKVSSSEELESLRSIFNASGIDTRRSVIDLFNVDRDSLTQSFELRNAIYIEGSIKIAEKSCKQALENWGGNPKDITHIVSVSTTGEQIPGLEFLLIERLGLSSMVERVGVNLMGCFGAIPGLKTASALARLSRRNRVLLVCTEICTPHAEVEPTKENFVGAAIFADGSGAAVIGCGPFQDFETPMYQILKTQSKAVPDSTDKMGWKVTDEGWKLTLSKDIPILIHDAMGQICDRLLGVIGREQVDWALHPGGKAILLASESALGLSKQQTQDCWDILQMYGNMSSATIMHVLFRYCYTNIDARKKLLAALAFGPGLSIETALLRKVVKE